MGNPFVRALEVLCEANESLGLSPREAFERAFAQVTSATTEDVLLLGTR